MKLKILAICLICLMLGMSIMDAPEYVRCSHIGLCEFLELHGHLINILQLKKMTHIVHKIRTHFLSVLEEILSRKNLIQKIMFFCIAMLFKSFKVLGARYTTPVFLLEEIRNKYPIFGNFTPIQTLALLQTSVILS